jgi:hypothetical protein
MMAVRLVILGTEARYHYIRPKIPDDPYDVSKNFVVIPDVQRFISRFRKPEIECSREELPGVVDAARIQQFLCSNDAEALAQFWSQYILTSVAARNRKISGVVKGTVRPERHQICVFVVRVRGDVKNAAKHVELVQCELNLAGVHLLWRQRRRGIGRLRATRDS